LKGEFAMNKKEIGDKVFGILQQIINKEKKPPKTYDEDISKLLDSIEFVSLIVEIENMFDIEISDDDFDLSNMDNINKICELIISYKNNIEFGESQQKNEY
jgi:acyl carrier protein